MFYSHSSKYEPCEMEVEFHGWLDEKRKKNQAYYDVSLIYVLQFEVPHLKIQFYNLFYLLASRSRRNINCLKIVSRY